jgi:hypothetical protein
MELEKVITIGHVGIVVGKKCMVGALERLISE